MLEEVIKETPSCSTVPHPAPAGYPGFRARAGRRQGHPDPSSGVHAFNADFDGDQMAVHLPLSAEAQAEARILMLSANNILSPATGRPIVTPTQDMVFGAYYLTLVKDGMKGEGRVFRHLHEVRHALDVGAVDLHAKVTWRRPIVPAAIDLDAAAPDLTALNGPALNGPALNGSPVVGAAIAGATVDAAAAGGAAVDGARPPTVPPSTGLCVLAPDPKEAAFDGPPRSTRSSRRRRAGSSSTPPCPLISRSSTTSWARASAPAASVPSSRCWPAIIAGWRWPTASTRSRNCASATPPSPA